MEVLSNNLAHPTLPALTAGMAEPVVLTGGSVCDLAALDPEQLRQLHWREEQVLARRIAEAPKGSRQRDVATRLAYDTIARILAVRNRGACQPLAMGMDARYERLVLGLLRRQARRVRPSLFEIGFGAGFLLKAVAEEGFEVGGVEVSGALFRRACELLRPDCRERLFVGDVRMIAKSQPHRHSLVYWNDVFEHIPRDEILEYLEAIRSMLMPGGLLVTLTPNWHLRPSDITREFRPPRHEAVGLHLKEYTLREVTGLLRRAGFTSVRAALQDLPPDRALRTGLGGLKRLLEPRLNGCRSAWPKSSAGDCAWTGRSRSPAASLNGSSGLSPRRSVAVRWPTGPSRVTDCASSRQSAGRPR